MAKSEMRLIKNAMEYLLKSDANTIPPATRGIYVLYKRKGKAIAESHHFDCVYIGMASTSIKRRVNKHIKSKGNLWTHFSYFEVWDNISNEEIAELEGLFRHLYKYDSKANSLNIQKGYKNLKQVVKRSKKIGYKNHLRRLYGLATQFFLCLWKAYGNHEGINYLSCNSFAANQ